jgi:nitroreductase
MTEARLAPHVERILFAANSAPSGENCQPWRFVVMSDAIELHLRPERDESYYSYGQRASYLACGAALENMAIAASREGYRAAVTYFPDREDDTLVARVALERGAGVAQDPLAGSIEKRVTNRKPYRTRALTMDEKHALHGALREEYASTLHLCEDAPRLTRLGRVGSTNEEIMLSNKALHQFFFSHVSWTKEEDEAKKIGFYIETLELPPPARALFTLFKHWGVMRVLAALGFPKIVAKQNAATNASASAIGGIAIPDAEQLSFVKAGRAVERLWLTAASLGLSVQPLTGVLFFKLKIDAGESEVFTRAQQALVLRAYREAQEAFSVSDRPIAFMFRIGEAPPPSAQAVRFPLSEAVVVRSLARVTP